MKKNPIILIVLALVIASVVLIVLNSPKSGMPNGIQGDVTLTTDTHNGTYTIEGKKVTLKNGISEIEIMPGSASKTVTRYVGNDLNSDINDDGREDSVFIMSQNSGGSGLFYYVVALLRNSNGNIGSEGILLGDRISPKNIELDENAGRKNVIAVHYTDRKIGEDFSVAPSVEKTILLKLDVQTMQFGEVMADFEGEADPSKMTLGMKSWEWISTTYGDGKIVKPFALKKFILTFNNDKTFSATTDCNRVSGGYTATKQTIQFTNMIATEMFCEGSKEMEFTKMLTETQSYFFTKKGELVFDLTFDSGSAIFK